MIKNIFILLLLIIVIAGGIMWVSEKKELDTFAEIKVLLAEKYFEEIENVQLVIEQQSNNHIRGTYEAGAFTNPNKSAGVFFAQKKIGQGWKIVFSGNETYFCNEMEDLSFPKSMTEDCQMSIESGTNTTLKSIKRILEPLDLVISQDNFMWLIDSEEGVLVSGAILSVENINEDNSKKIETFLIEDGFEFDDLNVVSDEIVNSIGYKKANLVCLLSETIDAKGEDVVVRNIEIKCGKIEVGGEVNEGEKTDLEIEVS